MQHQKYLYTNSIMMLITTTSNIFTIINKKEQAANLHHKYFHSYDTFYYHKQKGTSNKFAPEIFSFL